MDQKSIHIIEHSIKLFAKKGFSSTSVQEIANECGISKGAFYLHFKSKDALLLEIFNYYFQNIQKKTDAIQSLDLEPRAKFMKQMTVTFQEIAQHREFIIMQIREQAIPFNDNIEAFLTQMRFNSYLFYKRHLLSIYGKEIDSAIWEVSLLLQGIFKAFLDLIIIENVQMDVEELSHAMLRRMDFIVDGFKHSGDQPVITEELMSSLIPKEFFHHELDAIIETLVQLRESSDGDIEVTISVLLDEIQKMEPRPAILKGMLANLEGLQSYQGIAGQIRTFFQL
ncbi:TetR/AcrR family transcriptional regulator [Halobacillus halophilus]|uniref:TetR/AcrR family transcriptional regulator n=1 Tax=Halobacillus halophilus TaxID=1570 RepID=UPI001CD73E62|nr:TetR/AcrR family transcriptional regulator [Halobacillus halophilus]MCA1012673.1 TetR/AcrR family transcriptional regulator [Halobacillus halophilus]